MDPIVSTQNQDPVTEEKVPVMAPVVADSSSSKSSVFGVSLAILVLTGVGFYFLRDTTIVEKPFNQSAVSTPSPSPEINAKIADNQVSDGLVFFNNGELWQRANGVLEQITNTNESIFAFDTHYQTGKIVYLAGTAITNENGYKYIEPDSVYLLDLKTKQSQKIHGLPVEKYQQNMEYSKMLRSATFSPSGKKIAITSSNALWMYDPDKQMLSEIFAKEIDLERGAVYSYSGPVFSHDETQVVLVVGYYEGSSQLWIDLNTKTEKELPFTSYMAGAKVVGHLEDNRWLLLEYGSTADNNPYSKMFELNMTDLTQKQILELDKVSVYQALPIKDGFALYGQDQRSTLNAQGITIYENDNIIMIWNKSTNGVKEISRWTVNNEQTKVSSGVGRFIHKDSSRNEFYFEIFQSTIGPNSNTMRIIQRYNPEKDTIETVEASASLTAHY